MNRGGITNQVIHPFSENSITMIYHRWKNDPNKPLWEKKTEGGLRLRNNLERIKPGQRIRATREELGRHIGEFELIETPKSKSKKTSSSTRSSKPKFDPEMIREDQNPSKETTKKSDSKDESMGSSTDVEK